MVKAIETVYNGYRFRSRLEARWAVFFDALGIEYEYEPEGYEYFDVYGNQMRWLPDFRLNSEAGLLVEVKGSDESLRKDWPRLIAAVERENTPASNGLIILGDIPNPDDIRFGMLPVFNYLERRLPTEQDICAMLDMHALYGVDPNVKALEWTIIDYAAFFPFKMDVPTSVCECESPHNRTVASYVIRGIKNIKEKVFKVGDEDGVLHSVDTPGPYRVTTKTRIAQLRSYKLDRLKAAYKVARQARFEHGETPKVSRVS